VSVPRIPLSTKITNAMRVPTIVTWNRLEGRPRSNDFERSLRAEIRDPLWMLTRQWQLGELTAADGGTPVLARVGCDTQQLDGFIDGAGTSSQAEMDLPLEARIEREATAPDLRAAIHAGSMWLRCLIARVGDDRYRTLFLDAYPIAASAVGDSAAVGAWRAAGATRTPDGLALLAALRSGTAAEDTQAAGLKVADSDRPHVAAAASDFLALYSRAVTVPAATERTWDPQRLEYRCSLTMRSAAGSTQLDASELHGGHLDWYSFDAGAQTLNNEANPTTRAYIPAPIAFAGMPAARWWQLEDGRVDFGAVDAQPTDLATLLLIEFALTYGNDWGIVALPVPAGTLCRITSLSITDVFGQQTPVPPTSADGSTWSMFELAGPRPGPLFVPASRAAATGPDLERVEVVRDEMANLVWGIEATIPDGLGGGAPTAVDPTWQSAPSSTAPLRYRLMGSVPTSWIPFLPTHVPGSNRETQLQRGAMPSQGGGGIEPRGVLLRPEPVTSAYFIHEEEVGRAGVQLVRTWNRTRTADGRVFVWCGRERTAGRGEGASGLRFDAVEFVQP
jgi:hypothetical protein